LQHNQSSKSEKLIGENKDNPERTNNNNEYSWVLKIEGISKYFINEMNEKIPVLENLSLTLKKNEFHSIIGPSGCGKTTLLRILAGFDMKFKGNIYLPDYVISTNNNEKSLLLGKIGYIPQEESLFPWLTVEKNIEIGLNFLKFSKQEKKKIVSNLLELVGLEKYRNYYPKEISGGMKQKVVICRALAVNPKYNILLMDEPFSALDSQSRNKMQEELLKIWEKKKMTILFVTHNIDESVFLSDRISIMTKKPSRIKETIEVSLPRPRDRTSVEFNKIRKYLLDSLYEEREN